MHSNIDDTLIQISSIVPANEAEVETKILLHIFRLLGYTDFDRADKPTINMKFGRESKQKIPDFIIYDGSERTPSKALIAVETKAIKESLEDAESQVKSYATFAGTPYFVACNGEQLIVALFIPGSASIKSEKFIISDLFQTWPRLKKFLQRAEVILNKERLEYLANFIPNIEQLPASEFFKQYLNQLNNRFSSIKVTKDALKPPAHGEIVLPSIPVKVKLDCLSDYRELSDMDIVEYLKNENSCLAIEGFPGSGKTTLCHRVVTKLAEESRNPGSTIIPIYVKLYNGIPNTISEALKQACSEMGVRVFPALFEKSIESNHIIMILDGLDELFHNYLISDKITNFFNENAKCSILITSRPLDKSFSEYIKNKSFVFGSINELSDSEIFNFLSYYIDYIKLKNFIKNSSLNSIRSPLLILMLIRVAEKYDCWNSFTQYDLYEKYVCVLHEYFNSSTVRGNEEVVPVDKILLCLATATNIIIRHRSLNGDISLKDLKNELEKSFDENIIIALYNTGLITSNGGKATFIHFSFEEFGTAISINNSIKSRNVIEFISFSVSSSNSYKIVFSALNKEDILLLRSYLTNSRNKVRRRAMGILKYNNSPEIMVELRDSIMQNEFAKFPGSLIELFIINKDRIFIEWFLKTESIKRKKKINIFQKIVNSNNYREFIDTFLVILNNNFDYTLLWLILRFCINFNHEGEYFESILDLYWMQSDEKRAIFCSFLGKYYNNSNSWGLSIAVSKIIANERLPRALIRLLPFLIYNSDILCDNTLRNIYNLLSQAIRLKSSDYKHLGKFVELAKKYDAHNNELDKILIICCNLLKKQHLNYS